MLSLVLALPLILLPSGDVAVAQSPKDEIGVWGGAVWRFQLVPMKGNPSKSNLRGRFRIESLVLYQGEGPEDKEMKREVGKSDPGRGKKPKFTILTFESLRAVDRTRSIVTISGKGRLTPDGRGESKGVITTSDGYHWEMKCSRIQE